MGKFLAKLKGRRKSRSPFYQVNRLEFMSDKKCRWGFLSAAWIGMKNWQSVALSGNGEIVAVASRDKD